jgi:hypothetical protein
MNDKKRSTRVKTDAQDLFKTIAQIYFPRWRNTPKWRCVDGPHAHWVDARGAVHSSSEEGHCDPDTKTIYISLPTPAVMIHEITHAVAGSSHGTAFRRRMLKAAKTADQQGDATLAATIQDDIRMLEEGEVFSVRNVYNTLGDWVVGCVDMDPRPTLDDMVQRLARLYGLPAPELYRRCRRLQRVYDRALEDALEE